MIGNRFQRLYRILLVRTLQQLFFKRRTENRIALDQGTDLAFSSCTVEIIWKSAAIRSAFRSMYFCTFWS